MLKAIIFDVGGVLIRTHSREGRERWAKKLGVTPSELERLVFNSDSGRARQTGAITNEAHWHWLGKHLGLKPMELTRLRHDFFAEDRMNEPLVAYIKRLREAGYTLGILSNYGDDARREWTETYPFLHLFDGVIISAEVGLTKPTAEIYHRALTSVGGVAAQEALFIDDFIENVEGARAVGLQAIHFTAPETVLTALREKTGVA